MSYIYERILSPSSADGDDSNKLFNVAIATIFAREFLEGAIIISQYRTVIQRNEDWSAEIKERALKTVTRSSLFAAALAIVVVLAVAIPLGILSNELDNRVVEIIEGVSKVVAAVCIVQLSVKIPVWLGIYWKVSIFPWKNKGKNITGNEKLPEVDGDEMEETEEAINEDKLSFAELRFNVAWNLWRECAECGVFLIPFFLGTGAEAIPLSAFVGIVVALFLGAGIYIANKKLQNKLYLAIFMSGLTLFLAVGLFVGGCHEFEEVWGETRTVWEIENDGWSHKKFPMVIFKPFGYSSKRTVLQITTFWLFLAAGLFYHFLKWNATRTAKNLATKNMNDTDNADASGKVLEDGSDVEKGGSETKNENSDDAGSSGDASA